MQNPSLKPEAPNSLYCSPDLYRQLKENNWPFSSAGDSHLEFQIRTESKVSQRFTILSLCWWICLSVQKRFEEEAVSVVAIIMDFIFTSSTSSQSKRPQLLLAVIKIMSLCSFPYKESRNLKVDIVLYLRWYHTLQVKFDLLV